MIHLYTNNTKETSNQVNPVSKPETESRIVKASEMAVNFTGNNFASFYENQNGATDSAFDAFDFDIKNNADFMTVMASTMSGEDFTEMLEEGHRPSDMDESDSINSLDKIKAELARYRCLPRQVTCHLYRIQGEGSVKDRLPPHHFPGLS